jgi:transposase
MIGLLVNDDGFPISYQVFEGNKFEGHTLMPSILAIKKKYKIEEMTVVADAAMISDDNVFFLKSNNLNYIVGARIANLSIFDIEKISKELNLKDNATFRIKTSKGILICHFANNRYRKDKIEMEKQINKAKFLLKESDPNPARKRTKFLQHKNNDKNNYELNQKLIHKTSLLLGIKGYYSNLENVNDIEIIAQYRNLWHVEKAFRISKSDLQIRPIFHFKEYSIQAHLLVCFMALAICKFIEIKTEMSIQSVLKLLRGVTDARIFDKVSKREVVLRSEIRSEIAEVLRKVGLSY